MMEINYSLEVRQAIKNYEPVVALESTIITHGMLGQKTENGSKC